MAVDPVTIGVVGVVASLALTFFTGITDFAPGACERLEPYLLSQVVGQELAIHQLCDAVCDHIQKQQPHKPLVLSVHGPPGVGKSMLHHLAAKALYNKDPITATSCPGSDCPGYKVLYGMDYILVEREQQHLLLRESLLDHLRRAPQSLIVIEEYDKLDCPTRGMFRQLLENAQTANVTMDRAVVILESNTGYTQLHEMLVQAGDRSKIAPEAAQRVLKDLVFDIWQRGECEDRTDTLKMVGLIDFFLPFLPLERPHIKQLFEMRLLEKAQQMRQSMGTDLAWDDAVLAFLTGKVDLEGAYPIEGAKEAPYMTYG
ncbi:hypothetical protein WJX72_010727 [[Myrmecia] bisecta]|uniref:AAA+ ATPase domain-containing protein n=1 Tax=[Myrmecia] bisecta TaxID=41462 RepID=A0AAW1R8X4_9CHLO